ncbi:hypothetical protein SAMN05428989_1109 [Pseudoxanthomonas sp. GM95]|uniref:hypothetical protein n=1 Tax=Pseudoxanthomonas sp. GM95 TaxID=1881043 RepID=UPI0008CD180A|nr:hypothetical protein [Pseudoxanthomonas sp. GM95]SEK93940.1 hypothetical protein SAMN05428989_1109 [Pseudoxanthomonas sp. GM95]
MSPLAVFRKIMNPKVQNESAISQAFERVIANQSKGLRDFSAPRRNQLGAARVSMSGPRRLGRDFGIIPMMGVKLP